MSGRAATEVVRPGNFALSVNDPGTSLPKGWAWTLLTNVAELATGHTPSRKFPEYWGGDVPWISVKDARPFHGQVISETSEYTNQLGIDNSAAVVLPKNTVCLSRTGSIGYVIRLGREMATSQGFVNWICGNGILPEFLAKLFESEKDCLEEWSEGMAHTTIYFPEVKAFTIGLPPLPEQRRIVSKIESLQERSSRARRALSEVGPLLEQFRQSVLHAAFSGRLTADWRAANPDVEPATELLQRIRTERRHRWEQSELAKYEAKGKQPPKNWQDKYNAPAAVDQADLPDLPNGWCWTSFNAAFDVEVGATPSRKESDYWGDEFSWVSSGEIQFCEITETRENITRAGLENTSTKVHPPGTVLLGMIGEGRTRGQAAILRLYACNNQNSAAIRVADTPIPSEYIYRFLELNYENTRGRGSGNNQPALNKTRVQQIRFPVTSVHEMSLIAERLTHLMSIADQLAGIIADGEVQLTQLDQSILAKAFRGELVPQDPRDEPASVLLERIRREREANGAKKTKRTPRKKKAAAKRTAPAEDDDTSDHAAASNRKFASNVTAEAPTQALADYDTDEIMVHFRQACWGEGMIAEIELLRAVAARLGYGRLGKNIHAELKNHLRAAVRRQIIERDGDEDVGCPTSIFRNYEDKFLLKSLKSAMRKGREYTREDVIHNLTRHLGYSQVSTAMRTRMKSIFNSAIRQGLLSRRGKWVWREG